MDKMTVGMVGVGLMGHGIARNLAAKGWPLLFLDHPGNQPVTDLTNQCGIDVTPTPISEALQTL